jgi:HAD superfamily hydrolase (TIGR01549 family)
VSFRLPTGEVPWDVLAASQRDELPATALTHIRAAVLDLDGTLVSSRYDWPAIRRQLGVSGPSIIDELNGLAEPHRSHKWRELEVIERRATEAAGLFEGVHDLLALLAERGVPVALVTNNTAANTTLLLERFDLAFDLVLTRDSGLFKPSGAPIAEAMARLGAHPATTVVIGDSHHDVIAARAAACSRVVVVNDPDPELAATADLAFANVAALVRHLRLALAPRRD